MHASHSSISSYLYCGKAYELEKIQKVPTAPAWWLLGGSAVHKATENLDNGTWYTFSPEEAFRQAFLEEITLAELKEPDQDKWLKAGYGRYAQGYEHWMEKGPAYVRQWADREIGWTHVELEVSTTLPSGTEIKAFIDRVNIDYDFEYIEVVDMKSGSKRPESDQQLGVYSALLREWLRTKYGHPYVADWEIKAATYMFKDDEFYPVDVSNWTLDTVDKLAQEWIDGVNAGVFLPNRGDKCGRCSVSDACFLASGDTVLTREFDRLNPNYGK